MQDGPGDCFHTNTTLVAALRSNVYPYYFTAISLRCILHPQLTIAL